MTHPWHGAPTHLEELARASVDSPDRIHLVMGDREYSFADVDRATRSVSRGLASLGLLPGDRVVILLPNRVEAIWSWLGANAAGLIDAPVTSEVKGLMLDYYLTDLEPRAVITTSELMGRIADASGYRPEHVVLVGEDDGSRPLGNTVPVRTWDALLDAGRGGSDFPLATPDTTATIIYTSGTTGPSKGVMLSHGYWAELSRNHIGTMNFTSTDVMYCVQPLCHIDPRSTFLDCLFSRCTFVLAEKFSASGFWDDLQRYDADKFVYIGTMLHLIWRQPDVQTGTPRKKRVAMGSAAPAAFFTGFEERFNVTLVEGYGMTEVPLVTSQDINDTGPGHIGRFVDAIEGRLVDEDDVPVSPGESGELVIRPNRPHAMLQGYWRKPEATLEAMRNLWFHTGDLLRERPDGTLQYVGRRKDSIRRRGENVSAWEVEEATLRHPLVKEAAAIGIPSTVGDEDVAVLVVLAETAGTLDLPALRDFIAADLPRFAVPRFIEVVDSLPKTPSERIAKGLLRDRGVTSAAYDAEA